MDLLGPEAWKYREELEEVKLRVGITHDKFDCWIFKFLENKHFDVDETVAKLQRRAEMERGFLDYEVTDHMREMMRSGIMQVIGEDKDGRVAMYVVTCRDFPKSELREERKRNFDMWLSYGTRLRRGDPRCRITLLVNQRDAGVWANTDMTFQTNIAFRIAKFYPGMIDRAYVCCMGNALSAVARPVIKAMPAAISDRIFIYNEKQIMEEKKMLEFFDEDVLPIALGGTNDCDHPANYESFAENVESYFNEVKDAISRGLSVKEYEQGVLDEEERIIAERKREEERAARDLAAESVRNLSMALQGSPTHGGQQIRRRRPPHTRQASEAQLMHRDPAETLSVYTCESEIASGASPIFRGYDDELSGSVGPVSHHRMSGSLALAPDNIARHLRIVESLIRMEEQEALFRESFYTQHEQYLHEFSHLYLTARAALDTNEGGGVNQTYRVAKQFPVAARSAIRGVLLAVSVTSAILLLAATVLVLLSGSTITTVLFMSIFIDTLHLYPLGLALIIVGHQCGLIGSRGFELSTGALRGQMLRPLTVLTNKQAAIAAQFVIFVLLNVIVLAVFIGFSSTNNPLRGLRVALGSGMYSCAIFLGLYHVGFPFGLSPEKKGRGKNHGGLSLYLFLDITEGKEHSQRGSGQTSAIILVCTPAVMAVLFGACFMITPSLFFVLATVAMTLGSAFTVNHFVYGNHTNINGNILRANAWIACVWWISVTFTIGFFGWVDRWRDSVLGSSAVVLYFSALTAVCYMMHEGTRAHRIAFRTAYASLMLLVLSGVGIMFYVSWAFGLVMGCLMVHSFFCFIRPSSIAVVGSFATTFSTIAVALTIVLYGFQATTYSDYSDVSDAAFAYAPRAELPHPVCLQSWGTRAPFVASDLALLNRLSYHRNETVARASLATLFPTMSLVESSAFDERMVVLRVYRDKEAGVVVASLVPDIERIGAIAGVTMWAEGIGLQPYASVLPTNWTSAIVDSLSFITSQFEHRYKAVLSQLEGKMEALGATNGTARVILTGHSLGGGIASIIGARMGIATVAFDAPGLLISRNKFDLTEWSYLKFVTVINTQGTSFGSVDRHGPTLQTVACPFDLLRCSQPDTAFCLLRSICGSTGNRTLRACGGDDTPEGPGVASALTT
mmetsp:Transcript_49569/g.153022  ORF Transcript_49569/g.153022 Transcript_49569/m.153022 type:complete len:1131 (-) Transcript_49569:95-3487(-)